MEQDKMVGSSLNVEDELLNIKRVIINLQTIMMDLQEKNRFFEQDIIVLVKRIKDLEEENVETAFDEGRTEKDELRLVPEKITKTPAHVVIEEEHMRMYR